MFEAIDTEYKLRFVSRTQRLLDDRATETHNFLDASLTFREGSAMWEQDLTIMDCDKPQSSTNPLINPKISVRSASHAYDLLKEYYSDSLVRGKTIVGTGIENLEEYCVD